MSEYPVQLAKVQAPPLRDETLERKRLLDWLAVKIHRRVLLVTAEAGYGKTTLLADFTRRSRVRSLWYRLDRGDRDGIGFIAHLVAAIRVSLPDFAPVTRSMLRDTGGTMPPLDAVVDTLVRELGELPSNPTAIVFDDLHAVDDAVDIRAILRELLARAPERLTFIFLSRRHPPLPFARLRALGEVAELRTSDLRFDEAETAQLFRETYALALEPAVVSELSRRTEGWAASLQLVRAAIRDRSPGEIRAFVGSLNGAEGELYDYLAEEVVGELPHDLQQFLMRTSVLEVVEPVLGSVAADVTPEATVAAITEGERLGLFSRSGPQVRDHARAHPLVRDFLRARLARSTDPSVVAAINRAVARAAEPIDWRTSGYHYVEAGDMDDGRRVLRGALETILATGAYASAEELAATLPSTPEPDPTILVVASRMALKAGNDSEAVEFASRAIECDPTGEIPLWNGLMISLSCSALETAKAIDERMRELPLDETRRLTADAAIAGLTSSVAGDLNVARDLYEEIARASERAGNPHFLGVALANLAQIHRVQGAAREALEAASVAISILESASAGIELITARLALAWAQAHLGELEGARKTYQSAIAASVRPLESAFEAADIEVLYGDSNIAEGLMSRHLASIDPSADVGEQALLTLILLDLRRGNLDSAKERLPHLRGGRLATGPAIEVRRRLTGAVVAEIDRPGSGMPALNGATELSLQQHAHLWTSVADTMRYLGHRPGTEPRPLPNWLIDEPVYLSIMAEASCRALESVDEPAMAAIKAEAHLRSNRWVEALRREMASGVTLREQRAATLLSSVGTREDIPRLAAFSRRTRHAVSLGRVLARRLAEPVWIEDLGRVRISVGARTVDGSTVRRKVLALLCLLLSKPDKHASREEVLEHMWPEADPAAALNSLNQTVYFLRRVLEPDYREEMSPGYVEQSPDMLWLDGDLVKARSERCWTLLREVGAEPSPDQALELARQYRGRFAVEFQYEDWSANYRDSLHAAYLRAIEGSLRSDLQTGHYGRGIEIAQLASEADPDSDELQLALLKLYRLSGSHAAAAEHYGRYSRTLRELGIEPPQFADIE